MPNEIQLDVYFKSQDLADLCPNSDNIIISVSVTYPPDAAPTFEILASNYDGGSYRAGSASAVAKSSATKPGCPQPCP